MRRFAVPVEITKAGPAASLQEDSWHAGAAVSTRQHCTD